jgi:uncharacterized membrane protein YuzA (DUF378 family)
MRALNVITLPLVMIGGLNWGLVGIFERVSAIFGNGAAETATSSGLARVVYVFVALAALCQITSLVRLSERTASDG